METTNDYINSFNREPLPELSGISRQYDQWENLQPPVGPEVGALLSWLIQALPVRRALELGSCLGYSTLYLAHALRQTGGHLTSIELRPDLAEATRRNLEQAGLLDVVTLIQGDAAEVIQSLPGPFDLILQDSAKSLYLPMLEACLERLRPGGVLAADDALFVPMGVREDFAKAVHAYNQQVFADPRLASVMLPLGDGLVLSLKKP
jgi:predicted O-methyltransferase YrrM